MDILDSTGRKIEVGNIVGINPSNTNSHWINFQGLVVNPQSNIEGDEYCVAVFFGREVHSSRFNHSLYEIMTWDKEHEALLKDKGNSILNDDWENCPRVVYFRPTELIIQDRWTIMTLVERYFKNFHHSVYTRKDITPNPEAYLCFIANCPKPATKMALVNIWGSVFPIYVCDGCFHDNNGMCCDDLPKLKDPLILVDGSPIPANHQ